MLFQRFSLVEELSGDILEACREKSLEIRRKKRGYSCLCLGTGDRQAVRQQALGKRVQMWRLWRRVYAKL